MRISAWSSDVCSSDRAIAQARARHPALPLVVEVETLAQLRDALEAGCDRVLIDDFAPGHRREAVRIARDAPFHGRIPLEVSGSVDLEGLRAIDRKSTRLNSSH